MIWDFFAAHPRRNAAVLLGTGCGAPGTTPSLAAGLPILGFPLTFLGSGATPFINLSPGKN